MRNNFFTLTRKPIAYATTASGRRTRLYDEPRTPWLRVKASGMLTADQEKAVEERIAGVNPADLTRRITAIQCRLTDLARDKTEAMAATRHLDMASLEPSIRRLQQTR